MAVEVLIGHGTCHIIAESSVEVNDPAVVNPIVNRIAPGISCIEVASYHQDSRLAFTHQLHQHQ